MGYRRDKVADGTVYNVDAIHRYRTSRCLRSECVLYLIHRDVIAVREGRSRKIKEEARGAPSLLKGV